MIKTSHRIWSLLLLTFVVFFAAVLQAQTFRGGINGTVADNSGASIPNAKITVVNIDTHVTYDTVSSSAGEFLINDLPLGSYSVTVVADGFGAGQDR